MTRLLGWLAVGILLSPMLTSVWLSFTAGTFLTLPTGEWSLRWYAAFVSERPWLAALGQSLILAATSSGLALPCGAMLAFAVARCRFPGRSLLPGAAMLPAVLPPVVIGMGLLPLLFAARLHGYPVALILAHASLSLPLVFVIMRAHFETGEGMEAAARGLGASPWQAFRRVTLPLAMPSLAAAGVGAFVLSLNEAMVALFLSTTGTMTLPAVMWPQLRDSDSPIAAVASCASAVAGLMAALAVTTAGRRSSRQ